MAMNKKIPSILSDGVPDSFVLRIVSNHTPPTLDMSTTPTVTGSTGDVLSSIVGLSGSFDDDLTIFFNPVDDLSIMAGTNKLTIPAGSTSGMLLVSSTVAATYTVSATNNLSGGLYNKNFHSNNFKTSQNLSINLNSQNILDNSANLIYNSSYYRKNVSEPIHYTPGYPTSKKIKIPEGYVAPPQGSLLVEVQDFSGLAADLASSSQIAFIPKTAYAYPKDADSKFNNKAASIEPDIDAGSLRDEVGRTTGYPEETFPYQRDTSSVVFSVYARNLNGRGLTVTTSDGDLSLSSSQYFALAIGTSGVSGLTPEAYSAISTAYDIENEYTIAIFEWDNTGALTPSGTIIDPTWGTANFSPVGSLSCGVLSGIAQDSTKYDLSAEDLLAGNGEWYRAFVRVKVPTLLRKTYVYSNSSEYGEGAIHTRYITPGVGGSDLSLPGLSGASENTVSLPTAVSGVQLCFAQLDYFTNGSGELGLVPRQYERRETSSEHPAGNIFGHPNVANRTDRFQFS
jgi:hypothetical protein